MSIAGIQSSRGDAYEIFVAFDWALTVLENSRFAWLEINSVNWPVDDVVVGKTDGSVICCQCKKNQCAFKAWSLKELADDLQKAGKVLGNDSKTTVCFYSRSPFGELHALQEHCVCYSNELSYQDSLKGDHKTTDASLKKLLKQQTQELSTYEFLKRTSFETTLTFENMEAQLHERLRRLASNAPAFFDALWRRLECLRARLSNNNQNSATQFRITRDELEKLIRDSGSMLAPDVNLQEVFNLFKSTSVIGREWHREIGNKQFKSPVVDQLIEAIEKGKRSILLIGAPGSGKTCVMLSLQDELEKRSDLYSLFIQSREFADKATAQERQAMGLDEQWVKKVARMADDRHVVIVIDSIDLLSIARERSVLDYFLAQIDRLLLIPNVTIVTACREFDRRYDRIISQRKWELEISCKPLDWDMEVLPLLTREGIDTSTIDAATQKLICNPRALDLFVELAQRGENFNAITPQKLAKRYLETIIQSDKTLGNSAMQALEEMAAEMLSQRSLAVPEQRFAAQLAAHT